MEWECVSCKCKIDEKVKPLFGRFFLLDKKINEWTFTEDRTY